MAKDGPCSQLPHDTVRPSTLKQKSAIYYALPPDTRTGNDVRPRFARLRCERERILNVHRPRDLPDFKSPPIVESVLGLQFDPIDGLTSAHLGLLWGRFRESFPGVAEQPPLRPAIEEFRKPARPVNVTIEEGLVAPRLWFLNTSGTRLIQVQRDRFIDNWRRIQAHRGDNAYERYEQRRGVFVSKVRVLEEFLEGEGLGPILVNQCEVTYVNHIRPSGIWESHGQIGKVFSVVLSEPKAKFLPRPEDGGFGLRFLMKAVSGEPRGRLLVSVDPAWDSETKEPIFRMTLTARGAPLAPGLEGWFAFFDEGRRWIVKGFEELTTPAMHEVWGMFFEAGEVE